MGAESRLLPAVPGMLFAGLLLVALVMEAPPVRAEPTVNGTGRVRILLHIPDLSVREAWYDEEHSEACLGGPESDMPVIVREIVEQGEGAEIAASGCDDVRVPIAPRGADDPIMLRIEPL